MDARAMIGAIVDWYDEARRPLPWRAPGTTPWGVLVSEFMCQQTQVDRVIPRWTAWVERWPTPADLASAAPADAIRAWDRLGYPRRATWLHASAVRIAADHGNRVPHTTEELQALPGVGEYTAAAVQAFAFGMPSVVLDTNVRRVLTRGLAGHAMPRPSLVNDERRQAAELVQAAESEPGRAATYSQGVMELGALVCTARNPKCDACPIRTMCRWRQADYPPAPWTSRTQARFEGSDRQARGRIMAIVRAATGPVPQSAIEDTLEDDAQRGRALRGLIDDGLIVQNAVGDLTLP